MGDAVELLAIEECDAWLEYLTATKHLRGRKYREAEPWAWARLAQRLRMIRRRRKALRSSAA